MLYKETTTNMIKWNPKKYSSNLVHCKYAQRFKGKHSQNEVSDERYIKNEMKFLELKNTITEKQNLLYWLNSRLYTAEEKITEK